jgi:hypothetical protein
MADKTGYTGAAEIINTDHSGNAHQNIQANPNAFGVGVFQALHGLAEVGTEALVKKQDLANSLKGDELKVAASQRYSDAWSKFGALEGDAAVSGRGAFEAELKSIYNDTVEKAPNDVVRKMVADGGYRDVDRFMSHGANYADTQLKAQHNKVHTDAIENNINQVILNRKQSPEAIDDIVEHGANGVGGADSVREKSLHKLGNIKDLENPEVRQSIEGDVAKYRAAAVLPAIKELSDENDIDGAERLFNKFKNKMGHAGVVAAEGFLRLKLLDRDAVRIADELRPFPLAPGVRPTEEAATARQKMEGVPTRESATALGLMHPESRATGKHASDYFMSLESENQGIAYINKADTNGSHSYGNLGLNSRHKKMDSVWSTSAGKFWKENEHLGLKSAPGTPQADAEWVQAAHDHPAELRAAEEKWWDKTYLDPVKPGLKAAGVPDSISDNKKVQYYLADRNVQQGAGTMDSHSNRFAQAALAAKGDPDRFIAAMSAIDRQKLEEDFPNALHPQDGSKRAYSPEGHEHRLAGREAAAARADAVMRGVPQAEPQPTTPKPDSPISPGFASRQERRQSDREYAHARANGNHELENRIYTVLQQRAHDQEASHSNELEDVNSRLKSLDILAGKGREGLTLEKAGLSEQAIINAYGPRHNQKALLAIETAKVQIANADVMNSMKFAPQEDIDHAFAASQSGLGTTSMVEKHRKLQGETGAFALGAQPNPVEDEVHRADLTQKTAATWKTWHANRNEILTNNAAQWGESEKAPTIVAARAAMQAAKTPEDQQRAYQGYAAAQISLQRQMGVHENNIHIMTAKSAMETANFVMGHKDPKAAFLALEAKYGQTWPNIFHDMVSVGNLPVKYEMVQHLDDYNARVLANQVKAETIQPGEKDKRNPHAKDETLPATAEGKSGKKAIDTVINQDPDMAKFMNSLARRGINMDTQGLEIVESVRSLAYGRVMGSGGRPPEDHGTAAKESVKAFIAKYEFTNDNAMIPKNGAEDIKNAMEFTQQSILNVRLPTFTDKSHLTGDPTAKDYLERAKYLGSWVNTPNGDGVEYRDHNGFTMHYSDGKPVNIMFNDLGSVQKRMKSAQHFNPEAAYPGEPIPGGF